MFSKEIASKSTYVLNVRVEEELIKLFTDMIEQRIAQLKGNSSDLDLRVLAVEVALLKKLIDYRQYLEFSVKNNDGQH